MYHKIIITLILFATYLFANNYNNGIEYYNKNLYKKAMDSFLIASNNKDDRAMLAIGIMYANGDGVQWDPIESANWFKKAALLDNQAAFMKLGNIYASQKDYKKAFKWFKKAADKGDAKAAYNLGYFYTGGLGVKMDLKKSLNWYEKAATLGYIDAQLNLGFMYIAGHGTKKDYKKAAYWIKKAKNSGNPKGKVLWDEFKLNEYEN